MAFGIGDAIAAGMSLIDKFIPDPAKKIEAEAALRKDLQAWDQQQADINKEEAKHSNLFVSGWRPFIGWVCGASIAYTFLIVPLALYIGFLVGHPIPKPPVLDGNLWELTTAMLGLGGLRTFEKIKGVAR